VGTFGETFDVIKRGICAFRAGHISWSRWPCSGSIGGWAWHIAGAPGQAREAPCFAHEDFDPDIGGGSFPGHTHSKCAYHVKEDY
jgi:hypothetical protein